MGLISVYELNKYYGSNHVLKGISFEINEGERIGLLGKNGSGKTTLFKVLCKEEPFESGTLSVQNGKTVDQLHQIPTYPKDYTVMDIIKSAFGEVNQIADEMRELERKMMTPQGLTDIDLKRYGRLQEKFEALDGYGIDITVDKVLNGFNIGETMRHMPFEKLSGGEKTIINLARMLLKKPDIMLLDEPTNHLDLKALTWLEEFLIDLKSTMVIISHDRYFLDRTVRRVIEIEQGKLNFYVGNYSAYARQKEERVKAQTELYNSQQKEIDRLDASAKRMHDWAKIANNEAMHKRAFSVEKRIERLENKRVEKPVTEREYFGEFQKNSYMSKEVIELNNISKSFDSKTVLDNVNLTLRRNERVGIIGENGSGKTTLLNIITGKLEPGKGTVKIGESIKPMYMPQIILFEDESRSILEMVREELRITEEKARSLLAAFHFYSGDVHKKISGLSGGERSRLKILIYMQQNCNLLILDEPTNHLDIQSREWLEESLEKFTGAILFVSHDRFFIDRFAERILILKDHVLTPCISL